MCIPNFALDDYLKTGPLDQVPEGPASTPDVTEKDDTKIIPFNPARIGDRNKREIVSKISYLIGIAKRIFENPNEPPEMEWYEKLEENKHARIIRNLCFLRTRIECNFHDIFEAVRHGCKTMLTLPEYVPMDTLQALEKDGINIYQNMDNPGKFIIMVNILIKERIGNCRDLFPDWVSWNYLSDIFIMPNGQTLDGTKRAAEFYYKNKIFYPYQQYMNWPARDEGNILYNDRKFLNLLYKWNGDTFSNNNLVSEASSFVKENVQAYIRDSESCILIVDCENSDPYNLYATLSNLDQKSLEKITKILIYDDVKASCAWKRIKTYLHIPVEYILINRVKDNKSLTDIRLATRICKEFYDEGIKSFVLVSSDSDYWGLIQELPEAEFLVMVEHGKFSPALRQKFEENKVFYCFIDDFHIKGGNDLKEDTLERALAMAFKEALSLKIPQMFQEVLTKARITMSPEEIDRYIRDNIKPRLKIEISDAGEVSLSYRKN